MSNIFLSEKGADWHSNASCGRKIRRTIASYDPDVVVCVHPGKQNRLTPKSEKPTIVVLFYFLIHSSSSNERIAIVPAGKNWEEAWKTYPVLHSLQRPWKCPCDLVRSKHTDTHTIKTSNQPAQHTTTLNRFRSKRCDKIYVASERIKKTAKRRGRFPDDKIVMAGLPIRQAFTEEAARLGDRTSEEGKAYQKKVREALSIDTERQMVLVMGGGEGSYQYSSVGLVGTIVAAPD